MLKKSILTPVLSGVLAVTVVGSGAYYFVNQKSADKDDESSSQSEKAEKNIKNGVEKTTDKVTDKVEEVKDSVSDQVDTIEKAMTGDLDFSYNASLTVTPGDAITSQVDLKSIALNASAKQKGDATQFTLSGAYDSKTLATANIIGDRAGGNLYAQVPELSSAYVSVSAEQLKQKLEEAIQAPLQTYTQEAQAAAGDTDIQMPDYNELIAALETIDEAALEKDIEEYLQTVVDNFPEGKDAANTTGTVDGVSYDLTTKTYDVTQGDVQKIAKAVLEKAKDDSLIKDFLDQDALKSFGEISSAEYVNAIDELLAELENAESDADGETLSFDIYFDADGAVAGYKFNVDEEGMYCVVTAVDDALVVDVDFDGGDDMKMTMKGAIKDENDTLNGSIKVDGTTTTYDYETDKDVEQKFNMVYTLTDVKVTDDAMSGTLSFDAAVGDQSVGIVFTSNSTADKTDLTFSASMNNQKMFDIAFLLEETDASDITVPTDAIAIDIETGDGADTYAATLDLEGFQANLKSALGDELYNSIFGAEEYSYDDDFVPQYSDDTDATVSA